MIVVGCGNGQDSFASSLALPSPTAESLIATAPETLVDPATSVATDVPEPARLTAVPTKMLGTEKLQPAVTATSTIPATLPPASPTPTESIPSPSPVISTTNTVTVMLTSAATVTPTLTVAPEISEALFEIGRSFQGRPINVYQFGNGENHIIFVGGIHGGYEWNTILLAYRVIDYFRTHPEAVPESITVSIIPSANPDGQAAVTGIEGRFAPSDVYNDTIPGRLNGNNVDLNRNWDCQWAPTAVWRQQEVSAGSAPFSERETQALRQFFIQQQPLAVIFWHSQANGVFAADCPDLPHSVETHELSLELSRVYGNAAGYPVYENFSSYPITGDAGDWLNKTGITSITIELITHEGLDEQMNLRGISAVLDYYSVK